jgi:hypothetical protein
MTAKRKTTKQQRTALDRQLAALTLRQAGCTFEQIAHRLGYANRASAWHAVQAGLTATWQAPTDERRRLEVQRLDAAHQALWPRAIRGDLHAIDRVLRVMVRRAKLVGSDAPQRHLVTTEVLLQAMAERAAADADLDMTALLAEAERILAAVLG